MKNGKKRAKTLEQKLTTQIKHLREELASLEDKKAAAIEKMQSEISDIQNLRTKEAMHVCSIKTQGMALARENEKLSSRVSDLRGILEAQGFLGKLVEGACNE